jgi:hypothetical protein
LRTEPNRGAVRRLFAIDPRSLAALRIVLALLLLVDLFSRSTDLVAHYTDLGVLPRPARISILEFREESSARYWWSLHMANGTGWFQLALFLAAGWFAVWLAIGYRTRLATIASWILLVSLHSRLPGVNQGGDILLRMLLFWSMFLPLGAVASIDRWRAQTPRDDSPILSLATVAILAQVVIMYWSAAWLKHDPVWTRDFSAVYYAVNFDMYAKPLGIFLRQYPRVCQFLTATTLWLEWLGPLVAFVPWKTWIWRTLVVFAFVLFHLGLAMSLELGLFSYVSMAAWLVFLPGKAWDVALQWTRRLGAGLGNLRFPHKLSGWSRRLFTRPAAPIFRLSVLENAFLGGALTLILYVNFLSLRSSDAPPFGPDWPYNLVSLFRLEQEWFLFAPRPTRADGWCTMRGVLVDGSEVNLWQPGQPLPLTKPTSIRTQYPNHRWRKYIAHLCWDADREQLSCFSDWLRWRWNEFHSEGLPEREVRQVHLTFHLEETPPPGQSFPPIEELVLWRWDYDLGRPPDRPPADPPAPPDAPAPPAAVVP